MSLETVEMKGKKLWLTKYLLARGLLEIDGEAAYIVNGKYLRVRGFAGLFAKGQWHLQYEDARMRAEQMVRVEKKRPQEKMLNLESFDYSPIRDDEDGS